jgi:RNA polymerase sigma-70 factor (ECF subfamily)
MPEQDADETLMARIAGGDRDAFGLLYRRYRADVFRFAAHVSGSPSVADDVVQDVFVAVIQSAARYRPDRSGVLPWLLGIARNHVRRWRSRPTIVPLPVDERQTGEPWAVTPDPAMDISRQRHMTALRRALLELPVRYREAIVLCDLQELSYADAALTLSCAIGTVRSRLHRGRARLARRLCDSEDGLMCPVPATRSLV